MVTADDLARLRTLAEAATPGPWGFASGDAHHAAHVITSKGTLRFSAYSTTRYHDAALIAAMRNAFDALLHAAALGLAWNRVEAALPEAWRGPTLLPADPSSSGYDGQPWVASTVTQAFFDGENDDDDQVAERSGPTPTAALLALAEKLEARA